MRRPLAAIAALLLSGPAWAQDAPGFDPAPVMACLDGEAAPDSCIGLAANACMEAEGGSTTPGMGACLAGERDLWDARLNDTYATLLDRARQADALIADSDPDLATQETTLREMQRRWIGFRDAACQFERARWTNGSMAGPAATGCAMRLTAEQSLWLDEFLQEGR